jgi:hypothetical protein
MQANGKKESESRPWVRVTIDRNERGAREECWKEKRGKSWYT